MQETLSITRRILTHPSNRGAERFKRLIAFVGWQLWKRSVRQPLTLRLFNGFRFRAYPRCHISSSAIYFRIPDFGELSFLRRNLHNGILIDVGANVGLFTLSLADKVRHAILFEPNTLAVTRAVENLRLNALNFEIHTMALSDQEGEVFFEDQGDVSTTNRVLVDHQQSAFPVHKVPCTTLDTFLSTHTPLVNDIDVIKIDVEGHENAVLQGMRDTLTRKRPGIVMFEYLQRTNFQITRMIFESVGYKTYFLNNEFKPEALLGQPSPLQNLFALPVEAEL